MSIKKIKINLDIILVNNGSVEPFPEYLRNESDIFLSLPINKGFAKGLNCGLSYATNKYEKIFILNNDVVVNSNSLSQMFMSSKNFEYVTIGMKNFDNKVENNGSGFVDLLFGRAGQNTLQNKNISFLNLACCIIDKEVFKKIGFLRDDWFFYIGKTLNLVKGF